MAPLWPSGGPGGDTPLCPIAPHRAAAPLAAVILSAFNQHRLGLAIWLSKALYTSFSINYIWTLVRLTTDTWRLFFPASRLPAPRSVFMADGAETLEDGGGGGGGGLVSSPRLTFPRPPVSLYQLKVQIGA